jgi:hypothetical protein
VKPEDVRVMSPFVGGGFGPTARLRRREQRLDRIGRRFHWGGRLTPTIHIRDVRKALAKAGPSARVPNGSPNFSRKGRVKST